MPVLFEEKRNFFSSAEKEAPEIEVVARNCSIVYCFEGRPGAAAKTDAAKTRARLASPKRWESTIDRSLLRERFYSVNRREVTLLDQARDGRTLGIRRGPPDGVAGADLALPDDREIEAESAAAQKRRDECRRPRLRAELEAGAAGCGDPDDGRSDAQDVTHVDADRSDSGGSCSPLGLERTLAKNRAAGSCRRPPRARTPATGSGRTKGGSLRTRARSPSGATRRPSYFGKPSCASPAAGPSPGGGDERRSTPHFRRRL